jgi:hypothetical protein
MVQEADSFEEPVDPINSMTGTAASNTVPASQGTATVPDPTPDCPTMGGITNLGTTKAKSYTGGTAKPDWSGLAGPAELKSAEQGRPMLHDTVACSKGTKARRTGIDPPFTIKGKLRQFARRIWNHMLLHGMDTIGGMPDPQKSSVMASIVLDYPRFTKEYVKKHLKNQTQHYDVFDNNNDADATVFLLNSLEPSLRDDWNPRWKRHHSFPSTGFSSSPTFVPCP